MLLNWLNCILRNPNIYTKFHVIDITEKVIRDSDLDQYLKSLYVETVTNVQLMAEIIKEYGKENAYNLLLSNKIPTLPRIKKGRFGEMITGALLMQYHGYEIPIQKLQYLMTKNQSLPTTDLIAIKRSSGKIVEVCYLESKLRTKNIGGMAVEGYEQLKKDQAQRIPAMLSFLLERLYEQKDPLCIELAAFMMARTRIQTKESFHLGLMCENPRWTEVCLANLEGLVSLEAPKLTVDVIRVAGLDEYISSFFDSLSMEADLDDE